MPGWSARRRWRSSAERPRRRTATLSGSRAWPLLAARMAGVARGPEGEHGLCGRLKAGLMDNGAWEQGPPGELAGRMVGATLRAP